MTAIERHCFGAIIIYWIGPGFYQRIGNIWTPVAVNARSYTYLTEPSQVLQPA